MVVLVTKVGAGINCALAPSNGDMMSELYGVQDNLGVVKKAHKHTPPLADGSRKLAH